MFFRAPHPSRCRRPAALLPSFIIPRDQCRSMFESIGRSFALVKASWQILTEDRKLLVFPVLSGIATLVVVASFVLPLFLSGAVFGGAPAGKLPGIVYLFLFYVVCYFVAIFFNTGLITCVSAKLQGRDATVGEGLSNAARHLPAILAWAVIAATVGLILRIIGERSGLVGRIATAVVGGVWSLVTIFVVPVLVLEDRGVIGAVRESAALFRKTWGESVVGSVSLGLVFGAIVLLGAIGVVAAAVAGSLAVAALAVALFIILVAAVAVVSSAMHGIFVVALYHYARNGTVPGPFDRGLVEKAFVPKGPAFGAGNI